MDEKLGMCGILGSSLVLLFLCVGSQFSDFFKTPEKNSEKGTVLLIVNLQFSDFFQFGNLAIWSHFGEKNHNPNWHVIFLEKFEQTKIGDLGALPEIWKLRFYLLE